MIFIIDVMLLCWVAIRQSLSELSQNIDPLRNKFGLV